MKIGLYIISLCLLIIALSQFRPNNRFIEKHSLAQTECSFESGLKIKFLGNTNILLYDEETAILTDAFFSRPGIMKSGISKVKPNLKRIKYGLEKAGISKIDAVIPVHSHYDHAMDSPEVVKLKGGRLIGSSSTMMIGKGAKLNPDQMQEVENNEIIKIGKINVQFIESVHWPYPNEKRRSRLLNQEIKLPVEPPVSIYDYKEGTSYTLLITYENQKLAIHGSAGFVENGIPNYKVDILFLSIAGIEVMDNVYNKGYQKHVVEQLNPEMIIPIHFDDLFTPLKNDLKTFRLPVVLYEKLNIKKAFNIVSHNNSEKCLFFLNPWIAYCASELIQN